MLGLLACLCTGVKDRSSLPTLSLKTSSLAIAAGFRKETVARCIISDTLSCKKDPDLSTPIINHACSEFLNASHAYAGDAQLTEPREGGHVLTKLQLLNSSNVEDVTALALGFVAFAAADGNG
jgi:hypothetical protein